MIKFGYGKYQTYFCSGRCIMENSAEGLLVALNKLQTDWTTEHGFGTELGMICGYGWVWEMFCNY